MAAAAPRVPELATPEKGGQPGGSVGQGSPPNQQKLSPGRQRMARELAEARQWLAEALEHRAALQLQQQQLHVRREPTTPLHSNRKFISIDGEGVYGCVPVM